MFDIVEGGPMTRELVQTLFIERPPLFQGGA